VAIGNETFVGSGSIIKEGVRIGNNVVVGAGKFVDRDLPDRFILR
jgi:acetyltransferase-like isoleucine patch superfamily enzyme